MNEQVAMHACCEPLVRPFIQAVSQRTVPLILDTTGAGRGCHLLIAAVGYLPPCVGCWVAGRLRQPWHHTSAELQAELLTYVQTLLPPEAMSWFWLTVSFQALRR